jgi:hypothetical protein
MRRKGWKEQSREVLEKLLEGIFEQGQKQFGPFLTTHWLYNGETCPGCNAAVNLMKYKGKKAASLNVFIYRRRGVLIGYMLCRQCAQYIFQASKENPNIRTTPLHPTIEQNLSDAYERYLGSYN